MVFFAAFLIGTAFAGSDASQPEGDTGAPGEEPQFLLVPTAIPGQPALMSLAYLNIRQGSGTDFLSYGLMQPGQTAQVVGKNAEQTWWAINYPSGTDGIGWCSAEYVVTQDAEEVPVIE
jgi:uncharacterized protein YraI